jgi:hypothetical protein
MRIVALAPPGRFPSVVPDLPWWGSVAAAGHELRRPSVNARWWRDLVTPPGASTMAASARSRWGEDTDVYTALDKLQLPETFATRDRYRRAVGALSEFLERLNHTQPDIRFSFAAGPRVLGLAYDDSQTMVRYALHPGPLAASIAHALRVIDPDPDLVLVSITSPEELLTALIAVRLLKGWSPDLFAVLADHSFGSYSLTPHSDALSRSGALATVFDAVIVTPGERDRLVPAIVEEFARGRRPAGFLRLGDLPAGRMRSDAACAPPPTEAFAPVPMVRMRLSAGRCYWDRCTFCAQAESLSNRPPSLGDIATGVERLSQFVSAGYRHAIFADEALAPAFLARLCAELEARALPIQWSCRSKIERTFSAELFEAMARVGCTEILFGIESVVPRVLQLMGKDTPGLDTDGIARICQDATDAGIGVHLNLIAGFPGERADELADSVAFVERQLATLPNATFSLTPFVLFNKAPIAADPDAPIARAPLTGDMPVVRTHVSTREWERDHQRIRAALPVYARRLRAAAGWGDDRGSRQAFELIAETGHGLVFRSALVRGSDSRGRRTALIVSRSPRPLLGSRA